jgi:hypothetical protein
LDLSVLLLPLQESGLDTVDANRALGLPDDCREYTSVRNILQGLDVKSIKLIVSALACVMYTCPVDVPLIASGWAKLVNSGMLLAMKLMVFF